MKVVWQKGEATVRDVYEDLLGPAQDRLHHRHDHDEGARREGAPQEAPGRPGLRLPAHAPEAAVVRGMVREFVDRLFDGAAHPLLVHLVKDRRLTKKELEELARTIEEA